MRIVTVNTITEFCEYLGLANFGKIIEPDLETEENECDKYKRKLRDAEVLCTVAANADGDCLDLGTSHGRSAYRIATNLQKKFKVYTVNLLPEQFDASSGAKVTHLLSKEEIGSYFKNRNIDNVQQIYANTTKWDIPDEINNISVCYVDAAHDTELVYNDSRKIYPRIKNDGFICWHDFNPELRNKFDWIDSAMCGVEWFIKEYSPDGDIVHLKDSWIGVYRKQKKCPRYRVGLVLDREFHELNKWVSATMPYLVNRILRQFECSIISSQAEYEAVLPDVDVILSMEPGWAAPILDFNRTKAVKDEFNKKSSFILFSDPHKDKWREDYFIINNIDYLLAFYDAPTKYHFKKIPHDRILHFPWFVPDHWITHNKLECKGQKSIAIFGAQHHDAYTVRNWCRNFFFVENNSYSGVENKVLSSEEYILKIKAYDAAIAAGSESPEYRLTMPKYFEIPATGALLFAQRTDDLEKLGFQHQENCLFFTQDNFEQIAKEYLQNPYGYLQIRCAGRELISKRHSLSKRMNELSEYIGKALDTKKTSIHEGIVTHVDALGSGFCNSAKEQGEIYKNNDAKQKKLLPITHEISESQAANLIPRIIGKDNSTVVVQMGSIIFNLNPARYLDNEIINGHLFEEASVLKLIDIIKPGMIVLDVGANFGYYTLLFSKLVGPSGKVIAFEPTQEYCRRLKGHLLRNKAENVTIVNKGLSKTAEEVEINIGECSATLHWSCDFDPRIREKISLVALDEWWQEYIDDGNLDKLDFVKIDTDGHEPHFLLGALKTITRLRPIIHLEFSKPHYENGGFSCTQVADWLDVQLGYTLYQEDGNPFESREALLQKIEDPKISANILCFPRCIADENGKNIESAVASVFKSPEAIYLASADRMDLVLTNLQSLKRLHTKVGTYASVVGGLSGLNYLINVTPAQIVLFDINPDMLKYAELVLELIRISVSPKEFISRIFSRSVDHFLEATGEPDLNIDNQNLYLSQPVQAQILLDTLSKLSLSTQNTYNETLKNYLSGQLSDGARNCRRLLPCWPIGRRVPVGVGQAEGYNEEGKLEPNTNTFFYGYGWLGSTTAYSHIKNLLLTTPVRLSVVDLIKTDLASIFDLSKNCMIHISNIDDWFMDDWKKRLALWESQVIKTAGRIIVISSHNGISIIQPDPHIRAYAAIQPYVTGKMVEITHKIPWGFDEFDRINVTVEQYLANEYPADTTVLHILIGEGISRDIFTSVYKRAIARSNKVIILEHNRLSMDWHNTECLNFVSSDELRKLLGIDDHEIPVNLLDFQEVGGIVDDARNLLFVVGKPTVPQKRIKVLMCYDEEGWAWWHRANNIKTNISTSIDIDILKIGSPFDHHKYDLVVLFEAYLYEEIANVPPEKVIVGSSTLKTLSSAITRYSQLNFAGFLVNNLESYNKIAHLNNVYCCQNGVSEVLFSFKTHRSQEITACWVGNNTSMNNKGLDIIREACQRAGVKLLALDQSENVYKGKVLTQEQVRDEVYHKTSFYICASEMEGTPNPALESLACGLPVISTRVGNMPEVIVDGYNGYLVERNVYAIVEAIGKLKCANLSQMSLNARQSILNGWTWKQQTVKYEAMFRVISDQLSSARAGLPDRLRLSGFSFCIITNGKRPAKFRAELESIRALAIPDYEILVAGELPPDMGAEGFSFYPLPEAARNGRLGEMRNLLCENASYNHLIVCDDDLLFQEDFYKGLVHFGEDYDVLCVKFLNADGSRYWDWATIGGPRGHELLDYNETDPFLYVTGGLCVMKSWVADKIKWDAVRGLNQMEDVDFSRKLQAAGIRIDICFEATVIHNDWRISQVGNQVYRIDVDFERAAKFFFSQSWDDGVNFVSRVFKTFPGNTELKQRVNAFAASYRAAGDTATNGNSAPDCTIASQYLHQSPERDLLGTHIQYLREIQNALLDNKRATAQAMLMQAEAMLGNDNMLLSAAGVLSILAGLNQLAVRYIEQSAGYKAGDPQTTMYAMVASLHDIDQKALQEQLLSLLDKHPHLYNELNANRLFNFVTEILHEAEYVALGMPPQQIRLMQKGAQAASEKKWSDTISNYKQALAASDASELFIKPLQTKISFLENTLKQEIPVLPTATSVIPAHISRLCTESEFAEAGYKELCRELQIAPNHYHRKCWEYYFVAKGLKAAGFLREGVRGICFGAGREILISYFARHGCKVTATDLEPDEMTKANWMDTNQHADSLADLLYPQICPPDQFYSHVDFQYADMNNISDIFMQEQFDFSWSCCAFEHLGSIEQGKQFILNQMRCLKPGGVALHTTEFNIMSDVLTIDHTPTVLFRKRDIEDIARQLRNDGHTIDVTYNTGTGCIDGYVDIPPYMQESDSWHLRLMLNKYIITSIGLFITKKARK